MFSFNRGKSIIEKSSFDFNQSWCLWGPNEKNEILCARNKKKLLCKLVKNKI